MPGTLKVLESVTQSALFSVERNVLYRGHGHSREHEMLTNNLVSSHPLFHAAQEDYEGSLLGAIALF